MNRRVVFWLPAVVWALGIFVLSAMSHPPAPGPEFRMKDKLGHWVLYCGLGWLVARALHRGHNRSLPQTFWLAILLASAYGVTDEWHQYFVPHRRCDWADWATDTLGASAAAAAYYAYESFRRAKTNR